MTVLSISRTVMLLRIVTGARLSLPLVCGRRGLRSTVPRPKIVQFLLSDIGEGIREVTVAEWHVSPGDHVAQFDSICSVESDKASVNITSRYDGEIKRLYYEVGQKALVGKPLVDIDTPEAEEATDEAARSIPEKSPEPSTTIEATPTPPPKPPVIENPEESSHYRFRTLATPAVRRIAKEHGVQLHEIAGSGKAGRVTKEDILHFLAKPTAQASSEAVTQPRSDKIAPQPLGDTIVPLTTIEKVMFNMMTKANEIPMFTYHEEIDVTKLLQLREDVKEVAMQKGVKLTMLPFFIKALSLTLEVHPRLNASAEGENLVIHHRHNIGFAVASELGLVVPNVKDVQDKTIIQVAREIERILEKGRLGKFQPSDLTGGTLSVSNIGSIGGVGATPLLLPPQTTIAAFGKVRRRPVFNASGEVIGVDILPSSWTADHRFIDGASLAAAVLTWQRLLETPSLLMLGL